jgi:hypothetical protein
MCRNTGDVRVSVISPPLAIALSVAGISIAAATNVAKALITVDRFIVPFFVAAGQIAGKL